MPAPTPCARHRHDGLPLDTPLPAAQAPFAGLLLDCLARGLEVQFEVRGRSMAPFLRDGDIIQASPAQPADLHPGAIVLAVGPTGALLVHRVTARRRTPDGILCRLRGDAHVADDGWFAPDRMPGVVRCIRRGNRQWHTGRWPMRWLGRMWLTLANARAWAWRAADYAFRTLALTSRSSNRRNHNHNS